MGKYLRRYLIFWLPAAVVAYCFSAPALASQIAQWFCAFFMLFGWGVNTGMFAYRYPRNALAFVCAYLGLNILIIIGLYKTSYATTAHLLLNQIGGAFSFRPLDIFLMALLDFNIQHEVVVVCIVAGFCLAGWLVGLICRRIYPDPTRPRLYKIS